MPADPETTTTTAAGGLAAISAIFASTVAWLLKSRAANRKALTVALAVKGEVERLRDVAVVALEGRVTHLTSDVRSLTEQGVRNESAIAELRGEFRSAMAGQTSTLNEVQTILAGIQAEMRVRNELRLEGLRMKSEPHTP